MSSYKKVSEMKNIYGSAPGDCRANSVILLIVGFVSNFSLLILIRSSLCIDNTEVTTIPLVSD